MNSNHEGNPESAVRRLIARVAAGSTLLIGLVTAAVIVHGCGSSHEGGSQVSSREEAVAGSPAYEPVAVLPAAATAQTQPTSESGEALPPEIALEEMNTSVVPGQGVTIRVQATPDVAEIMLSDGVNDPQALVRDESGDNTWRVDYRVPLRPRSDRLGLSVTARNEAKRWRRVWVFLQVQEPSDLVRAEADSVPRP